MSAHLTQAELTDNLLGVSSLTVNAHLLSCPACADELERLRSSIATFRGAAYAWSESALANTDRRAPLVEVARRRPWRAASWILAAAAMILFVSVSAFYPHNHQIERVARSTTPVSSSSAASDIVRSEIDRDNELLSQVNSELAEAVPAPMQPLGLSESVSTNSSTIK
jgi:predicted anti-sigma-YlaC factor YlaD